MISAQLAIDITDYRAETHRLAQRLSSFYLIHHCTNMLGDAWCVLVYLNRVVKLLIENFKLFCLSRLKFLGFLEKINSMLVT